jgi:hypothetical protein
MHPYFINLQPNSTKSRKESTIQYYKNLQKQRKGKVQRVICLLYSYGYP